MTGQHRIPLLFAGIFYCTLILPGQLAAHDQGPLRLDLNQALEMGVGHNFQLQSVKARARAVNSLVSESWMAYLPRAGVSVERSRSINIGDADFQNTEVRLNLEQTVYDGGQRELDLGLARLEKALLGHEYRRDLGQVRLEIQQVFLTALAARGKILLNRRSLDRAREQLRLARVEEKVGFITRAEVYLAAARLREIELALQRARRDYKSALYDLKLALNVDPESDIDPVGDLFCDFRFEPPAVDVQTLVSNAKSQHPEILRSQATVYQARTEKEMSENAWVPRLTMGGYVGREGERFPVQNRTWGVNFGVSFPISSATSSTVGALDVGGNGTRRTGAAQSQLNLLDDTGYSRRILENRTAYARSLASHRQLSSRVTIDVHRRFDTLREAWESIRLGNGRVHALTESLRVATTQYQVGQTRRADILLSEVELVQAQTDLTDDLARYLIAAYELEIAGAVETGRLALFAYEPGAGNTMLAYLLAGDFESFGRAHRQYADESMLEKPETNPIDLIDRVEIDDTDK